MSTADFGQVFSTDNIAYAYEEDAFHVGASPTAGHNAGGTVVDVTFSDRP